MRLAIRRGPLRKATVLNVFIGVAVLVALAMIVLTVTVDDTQEASSASTVKLDTGNVTASISASGNVEASSTVEVSFEGASGIVREVLVKKGQRVHKGQALARVDTKSARQSLDSARSQLASAEASYLTATQGQTSQERARDAVSIDVAQKSVNSAKVALRGAQRTYALDMRQQNAAVSRAEASVSSAQRSRDAAAASYQSDPSSENQQKLSEAETALATARSALTSARNTRDSTRLADQQQIAAQRASVNAAQAQRRSTVATVSVSRQAPREGAVKAAQAQIDSAEVTVAQARTTLAKTTLCAPTAGNVATIGAVVGQSSSGSSAASSDTSSGTTDSDSSSSSSSSSSAAVTLTDTNSLEITADVAEADINDVKVGQQATVTLSANSRELSGVVSSIDTIQTVTNNVVEYGVTVRLNEAQGVKLGQTADVEITTGSKTSVLRVSSSALTTIGQRTTATVVQSDGTRRTAIVQTGLEGDSQTEIVSGLAQGDTVVLPQQSGSSGDFTFPGGGLGGGIGGGPP